MFEPNKYIQRRTELVKKINSGIILMIGNKKVSINYPSNTFYFRQDSTFLYYYGLNEPDLIGVIDCDENKHYLYGNDYGIDELIWEGKNENLTYRAEKAGITLSQGLKQFNDFIKSNLSKKRKIHFLPQYQPENILFLAEILSLPTNTIKEKSSIELIKAIVEQRIIKDKDEIKEIEFALDNITRQIFDFILKNIKSGIKESYFASFAEGYPLNYNCRLAYSPIITINGQILHNEEYYNTLKEGQLLLADIGSESPEHYASDITRTYPVNRKFTQQQKEIYELILSSQKTALDNIKPHIPYSEIHKKASKTLAIGLVDLGLMKGNADEIVEAGAHALFFPHGLGHLIGLDVHDMEGLGENNVGYDEQYKRSEQFGTSFLRFAKPLQEGITITVEPGIYFIPQLIDLWKKEKRFIDFINYENINKYRNFGGIRIEDNVVITSQGYRILGKPIPKNIDEIEI